MIKPNFLNLKGFGLGEPFIYSSNHINQWFELVTDKTLASMFQPLVIMFFVKRNWSRWLLIWCVPPFLLFHVKITLVVAKSTSFSIVINYAKAVLSWFSHLNLPFFSIGDVTMLNSTPRVHMWF